jgi:hypothetical protein
MSARAPRRSFAAPLVVTLAIPACTPTSPPQQPQPVAQEQPATQEQPTRPKDAPMNPPAPIKPQPAKYDDGTTFSVWRSKDGCTAMLDITCPEGATCNPPPPMPYKCPEDLAVNDSFKIYVRAGQCEIHQETHCKPNQKCNPPAPQRVPCPE